MMNIEQLTDKQKSEIKYRFISEKAGLNYTTKITLEFNNWLDTQDPDYLDSVIIQCHKNNIPITGVLLEQLKVAALNRLLRKYSYTKKSKVNVDVVYEELNWIIFKLIHFCHLTKDPATFLAAVLLDSKFPHLTKRASVLDKEYLKWTKVNKDLIDEAKAIRPDGWSKEEQTSFRAMFPDKKPEALRGNRRD